MMAMRIVTRATQTLVIGYGNTLRQDDGVGYRLAEQVETWQWPHVRAIACHQLTPELAAEMAECDRVIFVDAQSPTAPQPLRLVAIAPAAATLYDPHRSDPTGLLALTALSYGGYPAAYGLLIPTARMDFGETLSETASQGLKAAVAILQSQLSAPRLKP